MEDKNLAESVELKTLEKGELFDYDGKLHVKILNVAYNKQYSYCFRDEKVVEFSDETRVFRAKLISGEVNWVRSYNNDKEEIQE